MAKKRAQKWVMEAIRQFLLELKDRQIISAETNWSILKRAMREEFKVFLSKAENKNLQKRFYSWQVHDIGTLLRITNYLSNTPRGSDYFLINDVFLSGYEIGVDELASKPTLDIKITYSDQKFKNPYRLDDKIEFIAETPLPRYAPSKEMVLGMKAHFSEEFLCSTFHHFNEFLSNGKSLTKNNIQSILNILLQMEDIEIVRQYHGLSSNNVVIYGSDNVYKFHFASGRKFKSLSNENILSPQNMMFIIPEDDDGIKGLKKELIMDFLLKDEDLFSLPNKVIGKIFLGKIDHILEENGDIQFVCKEKIPVEKKFLIIFRPARLTLRYEYQAIEMLSSVSEAFLTRFLFPQSFSGLKLSQNTFDVYNKQIKDNPEHLQAVRHIVHDTRIDAPPFIIFGPPGTGKTTLIVEAIVQLYRKYPNTKILVTSGPNSACDEIALRLCKELQLLEKPQENAIARIYCRSQEKQRDSFDVVLREYSNLYSWHFFPNVQILHKYRIVLCTLSMVGKLKLGNFGLDPSTGEGIFTHVFVDEAAASSEVETLVGFVKTLSPHGRLILSGDHKQLGPIIHSQRAKEFGLHVSLMERLLARPCYKCNADLYDRSVQTRLCRNYRSHPEILKMFNSLFYENMIQQFSSPEVTSFCSNWPGNPNPKFPIIFHSTFDEDVRMKTGSCRNEGEIKVVLNYVKELLGFQTNGHKITEDDIGIISPYKCQYLRIQSMLNSYGIKHIKTGAAETFRGVEKPVMIVSFVRSNKKKNLGFLKNQERINVILSRAKSLLILVGNPETLRKCGDLEYVIANCHFNKTIVGDPYKYKVDAEIDPDEYLTTLLNGLRVDTETVNPDSKPK